MSNNFESPVQYPASGGFVRSPGISGTPSQTSNFQKGLMRNVVPCTVAQIWKLGDDDEIKIGDTVAHILSLVGKLRFVEKRSASMVFMLDDMTGPPIEVKLWLGFDEKVPEELQELMSHSSSFPYAHVIASLRYLQGKRFLHSSKILPIQDANEITMHLLEVIHTSMSIQMNQQLNWVTGDQIDITVSSGSDNITITVPHTSVSASLTNCRSVYPASTIFSTPSATNTISKAVQTPSKSTINPTAAVLKGLNTEQQMVLRVISSTKSPIGIGYDHLFSTLKSINKHTILQTVEFLINEGHVYNTIDDDHFLSTDDQLFK